MINRAPRPLASLSRCGCFSRCSFVCARHAREPPRLALIAAIFHLARAHSRRCAFLLCETPGRRVSLVGELCIRAEATPRAVTRPGFGCVPESGSTSFFLSFIQFPRLETKAFEMYCVLRDVFIVDQRRFSRRAFEWLVSNAERAEKPAAK